VQTAFTEDSTRVIHLDVMRNDRGATSSNSDPSTTVDNTGPMNGYLAADRQIPAPVPPGVSSSFGGFDVAPGHFLI
jgi:hypothetical protein